MTSAVAPPRPVRSAARLSPGARPAGPVKQRGDEERGDEDAEAGEGQAGAAHRGRAARSAVTAAGGERGAADPEVVGDPRVPGVEAAERRVAEDALGERRARVVLAGDEKVGRRGHQHLERQVGEAGQAVLGRDVGVAGAGQDFVLERAGAGRVAVGVVEGGARARAGGRRRRELRVHRGEERRGACRVAEQRAHPGDAGADVGEGGVEAEGLDAEPEPAGEGERRGRVVGAGEDEVGGEAVDRLGVGRHCGVGGGLAPDARRRPGRRRRG